VAGEVAETVVGGVFVGFAKRRAIENLFDEFIDGKAVVESGNSYRAQFLACLIIRHRIFSVQMANTNAFKLITCVPN